MQMAKTAIASAILALGVTVSAGSQASLVVRAPGLIYDSILDVTWLDLLSDELTWDEAVAWAAGLNVSGITGWRLPRVAPVNGVDFQYDETFDGSTDYSFNIVSPASELSHLYYVGLGNRGAFTTAGEVIDDFSFSLENTGPFENLQSGTYWSGEEYGLNSADFAWSFLTDFGLQIDTNKLETGFAIALADGDVAASAVPLPATAMLLIGGLAGVFGLRSRNAAA